MSFTYYKYIFVCSWFSYNMNMFNGNRIKLYEISLYLILLYYTKSLYYIMLFVNESIFLVVIFFFNNICIIHVLYMNHYFSTFCIFLPNFWNVLFLKTLNYIHPYIYHIVHVPYFTKYAYSKQSLELIE